jgi:uncharacterized protein (DUF488 family)
LKIFLSRIFLFNLFPTEKCGTEKWRLLDDCFVGRSSLQSAPAMTLFSIGHSNAEINAFIDLLRRYEIAALIDTRSQPYSRYNQHFSREPLQHSLEEAGIEYVYLGKEIGGRPEDPKLYFQSGKVDYEMVAQSPLYLAGIERLLALASDRRVAFMCAEADYKNCHRYWLITRTLVERGIEVQHILHSGDSIVSEASEFEPAQPSLF